MTRSTRREFTSDTKRQAVRRSGGICECHLLAKAGIPGFRLDGCGLSIGVGNCFFEHVNTSWHSGDNSLDNAAVLTRTCWRNKTRTYDLPKIAKTKRQQNMRFGIKTESGRPIAGTKRSGWKSKMSGGWERRP